MGAREAGGSRFCAVVRCVSCVQSSDMLAEPPNTDATRPWPRSVAAGRAGHAVGNGLPSPWSKTSAWLGEVRVKEASRWVEGQNKMDEKKAKRGRAGKAQAKG